MRGTNIKNNKSKEVYYEIKGRYVHNTVVVGYALVNIYTGDIIPCTREQTILLIGRGQVINCSAAIVDDKVVLRGKGIELDKLPQEEVNLRNYIINKGKDKGIIENNKQLPFKVLTYKGITAGLIRTSRLEDSNSMKPEREEIIDLFNISLVFEGYHKDNPSFGPRKLQTLMFNYLVDKYYTDKNIIIKYKTEFDSSNVRKARIVVKFITTHREISWDDIPRIELTRELMDEYGLDEEAKDILLKNIKLATSNHNCLLKMTEEYR